MTNSNEAMLVRGLREAAHRLAGSTKDYNPLLELIGDARFVLLGEASHGTHEFYDQRAHITKRLIVEKGFTGPRRRGRLAGRLSGEPLRPSRVQ